MADEVRLRTGGERISLSAEAGPAEVLEHRLTRTGGVYEHTGVEEAVEGGPHPLDLEVPIQLVEPVNENHPAVPVNDDQDRVVFDLREVQAGGVELLPVRFAEFSGGGFAHVAEDGARSLEELAFVLLPEDAFREAVALRFDEADIEVRIR